MKNRVVIDRMALPTNPPISLTLLCVTALKVWDAPGWAWGVAGTLLSLLWIVAVVAIVRETERMPPGFGEGPK